jgi:glutaredoxin-like YruB-family protein
MKKISNIHELKNELQSNETGWLLLYKKGSDQSDCAFENFLEAEKKVNEGILLNADVNEVRDIHPEYGITSVPSLLHFENGVLKNVIKGCYKSEQFNAIFEKVSFVATTSGENKSQRRVTVYTTPTCTWCNTIKRHLNEHGVKYREIDVSVNQNAAEEMVRKSGQRGVPQTDINGQIVVGFDKTRLNSLLGIN